MKHALKLAILLIILTASTAWGATHYVSATGSDTWANSTNISTPCSLATANTNAVAGDLVYLRVGTYTSQQIAPVNSGTDGNYITYQNYNSEEVIISGGTAQINLDTKSYIAIDGIKFYYPSYQWALIKYCDHIKIDNCVFDNYTTGYISFRNFRIMNSDHCYFTDTTWTSDDLQWEDGDIQCDLVGVFDISHFLFLRCTFGDSPHASFGFTRGVSPNPDYGGTGLYVHEEGDYIVFKDCLFDNKWRSALGTWAKQKRLLVDGCTFKEIGILNNECPWAGDRNRVTPALYSSTEYSIYRRNSIYGSDTSMFLRGGLMAGIYHKCDHNWFYNNTVYDTDKCDGNHAIGYGSGYTFGGTAIYGSSAEADYPVEHNKFINNIFWKIEGDIYGRHLNVFDVGYPRDNIIKHNIFGNPDETIIKARWANPVGIRTIAELEQQHVDWIPGAGTHYNFDPLFVAPDAASPDFTLQQGSPAIDAGTYLTQVNDAGGGSGTAMVVDDATPFFTSGSPWNISHADISDDTIYTDNPSSADFSTTITAINYTTNTLTLASSQTWDDNALIYHSPDGIGFAGSAPDIGAEEYGGPEQNTAPTVSEYSPGGDITIYHDVADTITANCTASDAESDTISYLWTLPNSDKNGSTLEDPGTVTFTWVSADTYSCSLKVTDEHELYNTYSFTVTHVATAPTENNFTGDAKALWKVDDGALTTDSIGAYTLTNDLVVADTGNFKEGDASAVFDATDKLSRVGTTADFNWDVAEELSVVGWFFNTDSTAGRGIFAKRDTDEFDVVVETNAANEFLLTIGHTGGTAWENLTFGTTFTDNQWYHFGVTYDGSDSSWKIRVWDDTGGALLAANSSGTSANAKTWGEAGDVFVGAIAEGILHWAGNIDEIATFDRILSDDEIDAVRSQQFPLAVIAEVIGISADGTFGVDASLTVAIQFKRMTVGSTYVPVDVTWTDAALPYGYLTLETGATDLQLYHSYPATTVAGSVHYFSTHATDANYVNSMIAAGMVSADLNATALTLNGGTFTYGSPVINCDVVLPSSPDDLAGNAAIEIDVTADTFSAFYLSDSAGTQITVATAITTATTLYATTEFSNSELGYFNDGPLSEFGIPLTLDVGTLSLKYASTQPSSFGVGYNKWLWKGSVEVGDRYSTEVVMTGTGDFERTNTIIVDDATNELANYTYPNAWLIDVNALTLAVPYPSTSPKETGTGETHTSWTAWLVAGGYPIATDNFSNTTAMAEPGAVDLSAYDGSSGNEIIINGNGFAWTNDLTFGDYYTISRCVFGSTIVLNTGDTLSYSLVPSGDILQVATATATVNNVTIIGTFDVDATCTANGIIAWGTVDLANGITLTPYNCSFEQTEAEIETSGGVVDDTAAATCHFAIDNPFRGIGVSPGYYSLKPHFPYKYDAKYVAAIHGATGAVDLIGTRIPIAGSISPGCIQFKKNTILDYPLRHGLRRFGE